MQQPNINSDTDQLMITDQIQLKDTDLPTAKYTKRPERKNNRLGLSTLLVLLLVAGVLMAFSSPQMASLQAPADLAITSDRSLEKWLMDYIPATYPNAKIDDHGGWFQAHIAPDIVVSWAEWPEEGITLSGGF